MVCHADQRLPEDRGAAIWSLYIVENRLGHLYTGITTDVVRRFGEHQASGSRCARALRGKGPLVLRFQCRIGEHGQALRAERAVKRLPRHQRLAIIEQIGCQLARDENEAGQLLMVRLKM